MAERQEQELNFETASLIVATMIDAPAPPVAWDQERGVAVRNRRAPTKMFGGMFSEEKAAAE